MTTYTHWAIPNRFAADYAQRQADAWAYGSGRARPNTDDPNIVDAEFEVVDTKALPPPDEP